MISSRRERKLSDGDPAVRPGHVRVLVVGDAGVGKSSLVNLILHGRPVAKVRRTVGCSVEVKHIICGGIESSSSSTLAGQKRDFFVELWDVSGHEGYKDCRSLFYSQINGVIFVHDLSQRRTKLSLQKWATEVATHGTFSTPMSGSSVAVVPVPFLIVGSKDDVAPKLGGSSGNLVDAARHWVEKQGFLSNMDELPVTESFPGSGGLVASAAEGRFDFEAVNKFFNLLIRRKYFAEESANLNSSPLDSKFYDRPQEDGFRSGYTSLSGESLWHNAPPLFSHQQQASEVTDMHPSTRANSNAKARSLLSARRVI